MNRPLIKLPPAPEIKDVNVTSFVFWRDSFLIFWLFSLVGHLLEYVFLFVIWQFGAPPDFLNLPLIVVAAPYGFGALGILWFVYPQVKKHHLKVWGSFILSLVVTTAIELLSAIIVILVTGENHYWNYSDQPLNLGGQICLRNSLAFGIASILFIYVLYPYAAKLMKWMGERWLNIAFWVIFIPFLAIQIGRFFYGDTTLI